MLQRGAAQTAAASSDDEVEVAVQFLLGCDRARCLAHLGTLKLEVMLNALEGLKVKHQPIFLLQSHCPNPSSKGIALRFQEAPGSHRSNT